MESTESPTENFELETFQKNPKELRLKTVIEDNIKGWNNNSLAVYTLPDGSSYVAYALKEGKDILIYDLEKMELKHTIKKAHSDKITKIKYYLSPSGVNYLLSHSDGSDDNSVKLWNLKDYSNVLSTEYAFHNDFAFYPLLMLFTEDNDFKIIGGDMHHKMEIWNSKGKEEGRIDVECENKYDSEAYYINGNIYILINGKPGIFLYDFKKKTYEAFKEEDENSVHYSAKIFKIKGEWLILDSDSKGRIRIWNIATKKLIKRIEVPSNGCKTISTILFWNEKYLLSGGDDDLLKVIDLETEEVKALPKEHKENIRSIRKIKTIKGKEYLLSADYDGKLLLWNMNA